MPIGIVCDALLRRKKLRLIEIRNAILQPNLVKLFESFKHVVKPTSNSPAIISISQFIFNMEKLIEKRLQTCNPSNL